MLRQFPEFYAIGAKKHFHAWLRALAQFGRTALTLSVLKAVFSIDGQWINVGKQPALCLG
jgi:hypothetical protein